LVNIGAKLGIKNSTVESGCPQKWQGIKVQGTSTAGQSTSNALIKGLFYPSHGYVVVSDNSRISDAYKGVYLVSGGVISATQSNFTNNYFSIFFCP
jgi:ABC-type molybdate transport system ATPase subunit